MKKLGWAMLVLSCSIGSLWAADPFMGTWKLNVAKSKFAKGGEMKEATLTAVEQGDNAMVTMKATTGEGKATSFQYTMPLKGGTATFTEGGPPAGATVVGKRVDANTLDFTTTMNGKQVETSHDVLSADGKTCTATRNGVDENGKAVKSVAVYNRQ